MISLCETAMYLQRCLRTLVALVVVITALAGCSKDEGDDGDEGDDDLRATLASLEASVSNSDIDSDFNLEINSDKLESRDFLMDSVQVDRLLCYRETLISQGFKLQASGELADELADIEDLHQWLIDDLPESQLAVAFSVCRP